MAEVFGLVIVPVPNKLQHFLTIVLLLMQI